mmetsp:Transcript_13289/g.24931  ORF Transcript_13289/g.24931 Transcript_13289/m.24931 type:complete len:617 (-) Transcript_13289:3160-5010(-)
MELAVVERWSDASVYIDFVSRRLMTFQDHNLAVLDIDSHGRTWFELPEVASLNLVALSPSSHVLAFVQDSSRLDSVLLEGTELFTYKPGRSREILGFEWIMNSVLSDLVVVTNYELQFLKLNDKKNKWSHQKSFSCYASKYWCNQGVMVVAVKGSNTLLTFFLDQNKGLKYFAGPKFTVNLDPSQAEDWASSYSGKLKSREDYPHKVLLCRLYEGNYFVHMNSLKGECCLYAIGEYSVQLYTTILCAETGDYELSCSDNLLLLTNYTSQETYVFDIRSDSYVDVPFCTICHEPEPPKDLSVSVIVQMDGSVDFSLDYQPPRIESTFEMVQKDAHKTYSEFPENMLQFVSQDLCISEKTCYRLGFDSDALIRSHPDRLEASLFLLRRSGYKVKSFDYIRIAIREKAPLLAFSRFFETINITYKIATDERKRSKKASESPELKIESGMTVLLQSDLYNFVFIPLFEDRSVEIRYLTAVLLEYIRTLAEQDIQIHLTLQILLTKMLIKGKDFVGLHQMVQYHVFSDSREIAQALLVLSNPNNHKHYLPAYQLAIDMLCRMKATEDVAEALIERHNLFEALEFVSPVFHNCIKKLNEEAVSNFDPEVREILSHYFSSLAP